MRSVRARRMREALGNAEVETSGAQGISRMTCVESGKQRRKATKAPPAEMFNAVANSSVSLPLSSRLRTKTGMASGRRGHFRRSFSGVRGVKQFPQKGRAYPCNYSILGAKPRLPEEAGWDERRGPLILHQKAAVAGRAPFALDSPFKRLRGNFVNLGECKVFPFSVNSFRFPVDRGNLRVIASRKVVKAVIRKHFPPLVVPNH